MWRFIEGHKGSEASRNWAEKLNVPDTSVVFCSKSGFKIALGACADWNIGQPCGLAPDAGQIGVPQNSSCLVAKDLGTALGSLATGCLIPL